MIDKDGKIWCSFIDWDMHESMKALEDQEFQEFLHSILKLQKTRLPQEFKIYVTTPQRGLSYLLTEEIVKIRPIMGLKLHYSCYRECC